MHFGNIEIAIREFFIRQGEDTKDWSFEIETIKNETATNFDVVFWAKGDGWKTYEVLTIEEDEGIYIAHL